MTGDGSGVTIVETDRLRLRPWRAGDEEAMVPIFGDAETVRYIGSGYQRGFTPDETRTLVARMSERYARTGIGIWPVVLKETGAIVGECGLFPVADSEDVEIAYIFARPERGKGYGYEAASAVLAYAFDALKLPRVIAFVHRDNAASIALVNRLGMRFDRIVRVFHADLMRYSKEAPV
ncbi:MAG: GNAT family N-acetyltransferase [Candidatus Tumulicola sp.]